MAVAFREATAADVDVVVGFSRQLMADDPAAVAPTADGGLRKSLHPFDAGQVRRALEGLLHETSLGRVWVITRGDQAIGYMVLTFGYSLEWGGRDAYVDELFVVAEHRGHGVGTAALRLAEDTCRALGIRALHLEVERANTGAYRLYRRMGFQDHDRYLLTKPLDA